jgi:hypothetical protein
MAGMTAEIRPEFIMLQDVDLNRFLRTGCAPETTRRSSALNSRMIVECEVEL